MYYYIVPIFCTCDYKYYNETGLLGSVMQDYNGEHEIILLEE